jgi:quinol monooxygenase YgiN
MKYVAVGMFSLKQKSKLFKFLRMSKRIEAQAKANPSCMEVNLMGGSLTTFYVASLWSDSEGMKEFVQSGVHAEAMKEAKEMSDVIKLLYFEGDALPDKNEAKRLISEHPKVRILNFESE